MNFRIPPAALFLLGDLEAVCSIRASKPRRATADCHISEDGCIIVIRLTVGPAALSRRSFPEHGNTNEQDDDRKAMRQSKKKE
mmetsp:Transcript_42545/g.73275  ORF Transcript_42545/g.73275 Transcript_42545/m.73275 type:complete len:83 (+) Transcript_42545:1200-1448(+)